MVGTSFEVFTWTKRCLLAKTPLSEDQAELVALFLISTWFQDALNILPCLVITGPAYDAVVVLKVLSDFCRQAALLEGFRRNDLDVLSYYRTHLIADPNLDKRTASLVSGMSDKSFLVVRGSTIARYSKSTAIYAGENPETHRILNSIHIHIAPTSAAPPARPQWLQKMSDRLPIHLEQYRDINLSDVCCWRWVLSGLSSETAAIATELLRCLVNAPELVKKLEALFQTRDQQRLSEMSKTREAVVLEALLALIRDGREQARAGEIADKANDLRDARGETARLSAENVGHVLKGLGLHTRPLKQKRNGLIFDKATVAKIKTLAATYGVEDTPPESDNLHGQQTTENK